MNAHRRKLSKIRFVHRLPLNLPQLSTVISSSFHLGYLEMCPKLWMWGGTGILNNMQCMEYPGHWRIVLPNVSSVPCLPSCPVNAPQWKISPKQGPVSQIACSPWTFATSWGERVVFLLLFFLALQFLRFCRLPACLWHLPPPSGGGIIFLLVSCLPPLFLIFCISVTEATNSLGVFLLPCQIEPRLGRMCLREEAMMPTAFSF